MESLIALLFWVAVTVLVIIRSRWQSRVTKESLCLACVNSVVTRGSRGQVWIACNYAGSMRPVKFTVCQCSVYCGKSDTAKLVTIEGFVRDEPKVYEEVAIS